MYISWTAGATTKKFILRCRLIEKCWIYLSVILWFFIFRWYPNKYTTLSFKKWYFRSKSSKTWSVFFSNYYDEFHSFEEIYKSQTKIRLDSEYQMFIMNFIHLEEFGSCHLTINSIWFYNSTQYSTLKLNYLDRVHKLQHFDINIYFMPEQINSFQKI